MAKESFKKSPFGTYDIRGIYGETVDAGFAQRLGMAIAQYLSPGQVGNFLIGFDVRKSSPELAGALAQGLLSQGQNVTNLGLSSTPRLYWHGAQYQFDGSIAVTASHLGAEYNGFKISGPNAVPLSGDNGLPEISQLMEDTQSSSVNSIESGKLVLAEEDALEKYIDRLSSFLTPAQKVKIAVDAGGSAAGHEATQLFGRFPEIDLVSMSMIPDGTFTQRSANPFDAGATDALRAMVLQSNAQLGAAFDGDADRLLIIDENGELIPPDLLLALLSRPLLKRHRGSRILYDLRCSRVVPESIELHGGSAKATRVGHSFIKSDMQQQSAQLAGELSGHYYFSDLFFTDNALRGLIELINLISVSQVPLSALVQPLNKYAVSGELNFKVAATDDVFTQLAEKFSDGRQAQIDGLSVDYENWWFNVRASQTEPLLRLSVGAVNQELLQTQTEKLTSLISEINAPPL